MGYFPSYVSFFYTKKARSNFLERAENGASEEIRTLDNHLGKVELYH
jgi:hypothetical protein